MKVHLAGTSDRILGATIVGTNASEVVSEFTLAIEEGMGLVRLGRISRVYPTYSAAILQAASAYGRARGRGSGRAREAGDATIPATKHDGRAAPHRRR